MAKELGLTPLYKDKYMLDLACEISECFGNLHLKSAVCRSCPIFKECFHSTISALNKPKPPSIAPDSPKKFFSNSDIQIDKAEKIIMPEALKVPCYICRKEIIAGDKCWHLMREADNKNAFSHLECTELEETNGS